MGGKDPFGVDGPLDTKCGALFPVFNTEYMSCPSCLVGFLEFMLGSNPQRGSQAAVPLPKAYKTQWHLLRVNTDKTAWQTSRIVQF